MEKEIEMEIEQEVVTEAPKKRGRKKAVETNETVESVETPVVAEAIEVEPVAEEPAPKEATKKAPAKEAVGKVEVEKKEEAFVNVNQMNVLKLALGWNESNPPRVPDKAKADAKPTLYSYRNRFFTDPKPQLEDLVEKGLMERAQFGTNGITHSGYRVTQKGIDYVAETENIIIKIKPNQKY